ncbi:molybdate ABC transporter substrate-binding protein [bacterium]|nr:molybdate ABC transporter substrate-binding protein [bacterium]
MRKPLIDQHLSRSVSLQKTVILYIHIIFFGVFTTSPTTAFSDELFLIAGAGLRKPTDKIIQKFETQTGHKIYVEYGGAGKLLTRFRATRRGDLFMPGSYFYIEKLKQDKQVVSDFPVVYHTPVIAVHKENNREINSFDDLAKPDLKLALGDPKAMAFGRTSMEILDKSGSKTAILKNVVVYGATVNQLTLYVLKKTVDASIIGRSNAVIHQGELRMIPIPQDYYTPEIIGIALLKTAKQPAIAAQFQQFVISQPGIDEFIKAGFLPIKND